jgi:TonB family protein
VTHSASSYRSSRQRAALLVIGAISIVGHAAVVAVIHVRSPDVSQLASRANQEWVVSCESDAALATSARLGVCASPFHAKGDGGACMRDAFKQMEIDLVRCRANPDEVAELIDIQQLPTPSPLMPDVAPIDDVQAAQLIEKEVAEKLEQAQKQMSRPDPNAQVVEITKPETEKVPDKARYLSEYDSSVEKQTVARGSTEKMVERPAPRETPATEKPSTETPEPSESGEKSSPTKSETEGPGQGTGEPAPNKLSMRGPGEPAEAPRAEPIKPGDKTGQEVATADGIAPRKGEGGSPSRAITTEPPAGATETPGGGGGPSKTPNLRPTEELLERAVGGGSVDHLEDAEQGDFTALNSRKWKYATFFNRMKRQVAQNWHPDQVYLRRDPTGNIYGTRDRLTILSVSLKPDGAVAKIYVAKQSGVDFLDEEAMRAFREAQPFPNPPAGLVDARSNLITFSFGFHFGIGGDASRWKVFRYNDQ